MSLQPRMADSIEPGAIPALYAAKPNGVAAYHCGQYAWTPQQMQRFPYSWHICVTGDPDHAPHARVLDVERGDATPGDVEPYRKARLNEGRPTTVYCDRSTVKLVQEAVEDWRGLYWWIATLDDILWTPAEVNGWLHGHGVEEINAGHILAIQWKGLGSYDQSSLWAPPHWYHQA